MNNKIILTWVMAACIGTAFLQAQTSSSSGSSSEKGKTPSIAALHGGFHGIDLGMKMDVVKERLKGEMFFRYRGDADVSFLPKQPDVVIDCEGNFFLKRGLFQFKNDRLAIIILMMNTEKMDYYTMFSTLEKKYGIPKYLDPSQALWESSGVRLALEKPLTVKYIDLPVFEEAKEKSEASKSAEDTARKGFLDLF